MKTSTILSGLAAVGSAIATPTKAVKAKRDFSNTPPIEVRGNAFVTEGGDRFIMRGIAYQPGGAAANLDPLANPKVCLRDIEHFKELGMNTIRVYSVDSTKDHDECMEALSEAGIYLTLDLSSPKYSLNREEPHDSYNTVYIQSVLATLEEFSQYDNLLAVFSGNEVINHDEDSDLAAPYVKALTRDIKNYQRAQGLRRVPVGYSAADTSHNIMDQANYFNCGSDDARSDFFALNDYSWCNSNFLVSGWDQKVKNYTDYGLPIFLSEWGCIEKRPRNFMEIESLMHANMTGVYSGGLMYEYTIEDNEFGIVEVDNTGDSQSVSTGREYNNLKTVMSQYPMPTGAQGAESTTHAVECPTSHSVWQVDPSLLPAMPSEAEKFFTDGAGKGPGLKGDGSQFRADSGTAEESVASGAPVPTGTNSGSSEEDRDDDDDAAMTLSVSIGAMTISAVSMIFTIFGAALL